MRILITFVPVVLLATLSSGDQPQTGERTQRRGCTTPVLTDFDIYMLKLVNDARRQRGVTALRFDEKVLAAATHHNDWMLENINRIDSQQKPASFTHYETEDGTPTGSPAKRTRCFTGVTVGQRLLAAGLRFGHAGENISVHLSSEPIPIDREIIDYHFRGFMNSPGHKAQMLGPTFTVFGCATRTKHVTWREHPQALPMRYANYMTQAFADSQAYHLFGVLYRDRDGDGAWTPRGMSERGREGLAGVSFVVRKTAALDVLARGVTHETGFFAAEVRVGQYDVVFEDARLPGGSLVIGNVDAWEENVPLGERRIDR